MEPQKSYDVFISYSRKDYTDLDGRILEDNPISEVLQLFDNNGISYWFDKEGIYSGSAFVEVITEAINASKMMVFISSAHSNSSIWTTGEIFEALSNEKRIIPLRIDKSQYNVKYKLMLRPLDYIDYSQPDSMNELLRAVKKEQELLERKRLAEEEKLRKEQREAEELKKRKEQAEQLERIKKEIIESAREVQDLSHKRQLVIDSIREKQSLIGVTRKKCPICHNMASLNVECCPVCGWLYMPLDGIEGVIEKRNENIVTAARANWRSITQAHEYKSENEKLKKTVEVVSSELNEIKEKQMAEEAQISVLLESIDERDGEVAALVEEKERLENSLLDVERKLNIHTKCTKERFSFGYCVCLLAACLIGLFVGVFSHIGDVTDDEEKILDYPQITEEIVNGFCVNWSEDATMEQRGVLRELINNLVLVSGGSFQMGNEGMGTFADERNVHEVSLDSFYIGRYEVMQCEWEAVTGMNPSNFKGERMPVECVSWHDCDTLFLKSLRALTGLPFRLPTEAEWEFAARGGCMSNGFEYSGSLFVDSVAWYSSTSKKTSHAVGLREPNELGLYDMSGNVWEWCSDWYGSYSNAHAINPPGPYSGNFKVLRGGSWNREAKRCRVSNRYHALPSVSSFGIGLRIAL